MASADSASAYGRKTAVPGALLTTEELQEMVESSLAQKKRKIAHDKAVTDDYNKQLAIATDKLDCATRTVADLKARRATHMTKPPLKGPLDWDPMFCAKLWSRKNHIEDKGPLNGVLSAFLLGVTRLQNLNKIPPCDPEMTEEMMGKIGLYNQNMYNTGAYNPNYVGFYIKGEKPSIDPPTIGMAGLVEIRQPGKLIQGFVIGDAMKGTIYVMDPDTQILTLVYDGLMSRSSSRIIDNLTGKPVGLFAGDEFKFVPHGHGTTLNGGIPTYVGNFAYGQRSGPGKSFNPKGEMTCSATWAQNKPNGLGRLFSTTSVWKMFGANFSNGVPNGEATLVLRNGSKLTFTWSTTTVPHSNAVSTMDVITCEDHCMPRFSNIVYTPRGGEDQVDLPKEVRRVLHAFMHGFDVAH